MSTRQARIRRAVAEVLASLSPEEQAHPFAADIRAALALRSDVPEGVTVLEVVDALAKVERPRPAAKEWAR